MLYCFSCSVLVLCSYLGNIDNSTARSGQDDKLKILFNKALNPLYIVLLDYPLFCVQPYRLMAVSSANQSSLSRDSCQGAVFTMIDLVCESAKYPIYSFVITTTGQETYRIGKLQHHFHVRCHFPSYHPFNLKVTSCSFINSLNTHQGELGSLRWCVLTQTSPASMFAATRCALDKSDVQMPAPSPYLHSFAREVPSFSDFIVKSRSAHRQTSWNLH